MIAVKLTATPETSAKCREYALNSIDTHAIYAKSKQNQKDNIIRQIYEGKLAEFAVHSVLQGSTVPDTTVYTDTKSFDSDLRLGNTKIHVKSQSIRCAQLFGLSWTFQYGGISGRRDVEIFDTTEEAYIALTAVGGEYVFICGIVPLSSVRPLFRDPKKEQLRNEKKVLYYDDIKENLWCLDIPGEKRSFSL